MSSTQLLARIRAQISQLQKVERDILKGHSVPRHGGLSADAPVGCHGPREIRVEPSALRQAARRLRAADLTDLSDTSDYPIRPVI